MIQIGQYYINNGGNLTKIYQKFPFQDGFQYSGAVHILDSGWYPYRFQENGLCEILTHSIKPENLFSNYLTFLKFHIYYNQENKTWSGSCFDTKLSLLLYVSEIESQEQTLKLMQIGAQEKLLTLMRDSGYVDDMDEGVA